MPEITENSLFRQWLAGSRAAAGLEPFPELYTEFLVNIAQAAPGSEIRKVSFCSNKTLISVHVPFLIMGNKNVDIIAKED